MRYAAVLSFLVLFCCLHAQEAEPPPVTPSLAINLAGVVDWNTELPLADPFKMSRQWISQENGKPWGKGPKLSLDPHGWVTKLGPNCRAETVMLNGSHAEAGTYTVLYEGQGKLEPLHSTKVTETAPGKLVLEHQGGTLWLRLSQTDPNDYLRNIRILIPGMTEEQLAENPWRADFLERWQGFGALRFMDFMQTNNSPVTGWDDRAKLTDATYTTSAGLPPELLCDLANRLDIDPWFCMPHQADDDYVRQFATMAKRLLDPELKVYLEYSNEIWNGLFQQHRYAASQGQKLGFAERPWEAAWKYNAYRSVQVFKIWEEVFGGTDRLVRILATQAANPYVANQIVPFQDANQHADALAIAPYMSMNTRPDAAAELIALGVDGVLDRLEEKSLPESITWMRGNKEVADKYGLQLICYEAGQHMVGVRGGENNEALTKLFHAANAHPRMGAIYRQYFAGWEATGGGAMAIFSSVGKWSKWGSWGLMQYHDDDPMTNPKMRAVLEQAQVWGQDVNSVAQDTEAE